jgi:D-lactate dehydrogenase
MVSFGGNAPTLAQGMCCGVEQNTYYTMQDIRIVLADGTVLDTADPVRRAPRPMCRTVGRSV